MSLINREELLAAIMDDGGLQYPRWWYANKVKTAPEVDAVEVVRCADCINSLWDFLHQTWWCNGKQVIAEHFCSRGEKKHERSG